MDISANIIIDILILIFCSLGILTTFSILFVILRYRQPSLSATTILLICNTYAGVLIYSFIAVNMYAYNLYGHIYINVSFNNQWCHVRAYLASIAITAIYQSYVIQACFRLFRVVFHRYKQLQSFRFISILVVFQWTEISLTLLPLLLLGRFEYITPGYYFCQISFTNVPATIHIGIISYNLPMSTIGIIYFYIIYYIKKRKNSAIQRHRRQANQRDLVVIRRISLLILILMSAMFPAILFYLVHLITGYVYSLFYQLEWLTFSIVMSSIPILSVMITPQLREIVKRQFRMNHRIHPRVPIRVFELQQRNIINT